MLNFEFNQLQASARCSKPRQRCMQGPASERRLPCPFAPAKRGRHQYHRPVALRQDRGSSVQASTAPGLSAVVVPAARHAQGAPRLRPRAGSASFLARVRPCCPAVWLSDPDRTAYRPSGAASRPGCIRRPSGDHFPFPVRGRQLMPRGTRLRHPARRCRA